MENKGITITNSTTLGTLVTFFPDITQRLNDLHIDYCCHGNITIGEAIKEHRLSPDFLGNYRTPTKYTAIGPTRVKA